MRDEVGGSSENTGQQPATYEKNNDVKQFFEEFYQFTVKSEKQNPSFHSRTFSVTTEIMVAPRRNPHSNSIRGRSFAS